MKIKFIENIVEKHKTHPILIKSIVMFSFFCSFLINIPFLNIVLELKPKIDDFSSHVISNAALHNFDISSRVSSYYFVFTSLFLITGFVFLLIFHFVKEKFNNQIEDKKILEIIQQISIIGLASLFSSLFFIKVDLASLLLLFLGFYYFFSKNKTQDFLYNNGLWILITALPLTFLTYRILAANKPFNLLPDNFYFNEVVIPLSVDFLVFFFFFILIALTLNILLKKVINKSYKQGNEHHQLIKILYLSTIPISLIIIVLSVFLEIFNVLNLRTGFVFNRPNELFIVVTFAGILFTVLYYQFLKKRTHIKNIDFDPIEKYHFPLLIVSLGFMFSQPWRMMEPENEFFEFANHGLSVDHFFRYGSIPIVETFDAHMLGNQLFAYVYGLINGYEPWAPFLYSSYIYIFIYLLIFFLLKRLTGSFTAFILLICFPMLSVVISSFVYIGIVALTLLTVYHQKEKKHFYWFWGSIIFMCLFRLDLGFACAMAGISGYFLLHYISRKPFYTKTFLITGAVSSLSTILLFVILCLIKGINPIQRLIEFLTIAMSNQNWAYEDMGDENHILFRITYYILPVLLLFLFVKTILKLIFSKSLFYKILDNKLKIAALVFFVFFTLFFYFNLPRGIVRHNFLFNNIITTLSTFPLALVCYVCIFNRKNYLTYILAVMIFSFFLINLTSSSFINKDDSFLSKAFFSPSFNEKFQPAIPFENTRVRESFSFAEINYFKEILDNLLQPDETYFDFSSTNYYHALVERRNPLYVNQSPLLLNGDKSQDFALKQILESKIPLVLMPNIENIWHQIDGIPVEYKYFKISEHIFQNYSPLLKMNGFTIYALNKKKAFFESKLKKEQTKEYLVKDFSNEFLKQIQKNDILVKMNENNHLILTKNGNDAFIFGLLKQYQNQNLNSKDKPKTVQIKLQASSSGSIQVYYWPKGEEYFSEVNSKIFPIPSEGTYEFELNTPSLQDVRIDIDLQEIVLKEFNFKDKASLVELKNGIKSYNLGEIPMVWGELSDRELFSSINKLSQELNQSSVLMPINLKQKKKPSYLFIEMESDTIQSAKTELFDENNNKLIDYIFRVNPGKHSYVIRLSSNYHWWNSFVSKINMITEQPLRITKFTVISEDGKDQTSFNNNSFYLSNITDENWIGGVGVPFEVLLMDNSPKTVKALQKGTKIELGNGSLLNIKRYSVLGNFIHVEVDESLATFKNDIAYPNNFKIIK